MSFFGVVNRHGGQYKVEYVKENLFSSAIEKIKQVRSQCSSSPKNGNNNNNNGKTNRNGKMTNGNGKVTITNGKVGETLNGRKGSVTEKGTDDVCSQTSVADMSNTISSQNNNGNCKKEPKSTDETTSLGSCVENITPSSPSSTTTITHTTTATSPTISTTDIEVSQKKDDHYNNINAKKQNSVTSNTASSFSITTNEEKNECSSAYTVYIDIYKNLNYMGLLTDQMMGVDKRVVQDCKSRKDM